MSTEKPDSIPPRRSFLAARRAARLDMTLPTWDSAPKESAKPKRYYSASRNGFFSQDIHGANLPADAVEITHDEWQSLLDAQGRGGKKIVPGPDGKPAAVDQDMTPEMKRRLIEAQIDELRRAPDTIDLHRAAALGKPGAREQLESIDNRIEALRATLPPA